MANPQIQVEIGAVIDGLRKGFGESVKIIETLENQARDLEKALNEATDLDTIGRLNQDLAKTRNALSQLRTTGVEPLTKATSQYNSVGIDFARIIQDAPFGIIGVGNNITQLATSFQNLGEKGDSAGKKFKLALSSIFSAGNLVTLGISTLVTALTVLQQQGFFKTGDAAESLTDKLEKYREKLETIKRLSIEGQANSQKEIQNFQLLRAQAENTNVSQEKRLQAVRDLQKTYPDYLGNLTQEQILTGNVGEAYNNLTKEIVATAKARAFSEQIAKNSLTTLSILSQEEERALKILQERDKLESIRASKEFATGQDLLALKQQENIQQQRINELIKEQTDSALERGKVEEENQKLIGKINLELENGASFTKSQAQNLQEVKRTLEDISAIESSLEIARLERRGQFFEGVEAPITISSGLADTQGIIEPKVRAVTSALEEQRVTLDELSASFAGLGSLLGQVFGNNPALGTFLGQFAAFAAKLIATNFTIASSNAVVGASSAAVATGPAAPFTLPAFLAASLGLIAGAFAAFGGKKSSPSIGTSSVGGGSGSAFAGGAVGGLFNQNREIRGELVARGTDLVYVFNEANTRINKG
jgi:hypothetical protein